MFKKIACVAVMASSSSFAADSGKFYIGADTGSTKIDDYSDREGSLGVFAGYEFMPNIAIEIGYRRLAQFDLSLIDVKVQQTAISAIAGVPLGSGFGLFGRLGYNHLDAEGKRFGLSADESTSGLLAGIGATYAFTPQIVGRLELQRPSSDSTNFSAGVAFKF